ncbi:MAG: hypothetical protein HZA72_03270 [Candidatus Omnitrophica bacterium]|nr:hypothetical protein [Candidatus Omnitrophota bacterium]
MQNAVNAISSSNLPQIRGSGTEIGNDYALFLDYTMFIAATFVTTNPVLVNLARKINPKYWEEVARRIIVEHHEYDRYELKREMTMEVVLANLRLLRPIFLISGGRLGRVSLQLSPKNHDNAQAMIEEATYIYGQLAEELGGVPNVVFKLPATYAGQIAGRELAESGIGYNATVNFGMFQEDVFGEIAQEGEAQVSYLTLMNGRLANPVIEELQGQAERIIDYFTAQPLTEEQVERWGFGVEYIGKGLTREEFLELLRERGRRYGITAQGERYGVIWNVEDVGRLAGVAVAKRLHQYAKGQGWDLTKVRPLIASLGNYAVYNAKGRELEGVRYLPDIEEPFDQLLLEVLAQSEIFKQAYYLEGDEEWLKPEQPLSISEEGMQGVVFEWAPVKATITQFSAADTELEEWVAGVRQDMVEAGRLPQGRASSIGDIDLILNDAAWLSSQIRALKLSKSTREDLVMGIGGKTAEVRLAATRRLAESGNPGVLGVFNNLATALIEVRDYVVSGLKAEQSEEELKALYELRQELEDRISSANTKESSRESASGVAITPELAGLTAEEIGLYSTEPDKEALHQTLTSLVLDEKLLAKGTVILAYDTALEPKLSTTHVSKAGEVGVNRYMGGKLINIRGTGKALLEAIQAEKARLEGQGVPLASVVTIAGDGTIKDVGEGNLKELGKVINVQNPEDNRYIPIIGLYDLALRIAYELGEDRILDALNRIALNPEERPFTMDDVHTLLSTGILRILPKIVPIDTAAALEAYKGAQQALISL